MCGIDWTFTGSWGRGEGGRDSRGQNTWVTQNRVSLLTTCPRTVRTSRRASEIPLVPHAAAQQPHV